ncbi:hypothetical protein JCM8097_002875 [Rhodosporidiobolus ruineniae]
MPASSPKQPSLKSNSSVMKEKRDTTGDVVVVRTDLDGVEEQPEEEEDAVFGKGDGTVNYRSLGWMSASVMIIKSQIGVGVLGIPSSFQTLGLIPGIIILLFFGVTTTWADVYIGFFKLKHPQVYSLYDAGQLMFGRVGAEIFGWSYWFLMAMIASSALVSLSTALNAISTHGTCTAVFVAVAAIAVYPAASLRTLEKIRFVGWIGLVSILSAIFTGMIAVAAGGRPSLAPQTGPLNLEIVYWGTPTFSEAMQAVSAIFFSLTGTSAFLPIAAEMRHPKLYVRAVLIGQSVVVGMYLLVGIVVYNYAGQYVASPALGTAGPLIKKIAYGLALPGLYFTALFYTHLPAKFIFLRLLRNSRHLTSSTKTHWFTWLGCTLGCMLFSYIVAEAIPVFDGLVSLVGALFGAMCTLIAEACMYLYDVRGDFRRKEKRTFRLWFGVVFNVFLLVVGAFVLVAGTYGSVISIKDSYAAGSSKVWSCADNSGSV